MVNDLTYLFGEWIVLATAILFTGYLVQRKFPGRLLDFALAVFIVIAVSETIKYITAKPRPESLYYFSGNAFPSTHTALAFMAFFFYATVCHSLTEIFTRGGKFLSKITMGEGINLILIFVLAILTGILRVIIGAHDYFDVFAGIILGLIVSTVFVFYDVRGKRIS